MVDFEFTDESENWLRTAARNRAAYEVTCEDCSYQAFADSQAECEELLRDHERIVSGRDKEHTVSITELSA